METNNVNTSPKLIESIRPSTDVSVDATYGFSNKTIIIILCLLIILILLNPVIHVLLQNIVTIAYNLATKILSLLGIVSGNVIHTVANVGGNVARTGVDITEGTLHSVGNVLSGGNKDIAKDLDNTINTANISQNANSPAPDNTGNTIQNPIVNNKQLWCLVGEYKGTRGCIEVENADKCMSGQVYPEQKMCLNPALMASK
jgi:hypothetical protein